MDALEAAGRPAWFRLGDRDLAMCLIRTELLGSGERLTDAHAAVVRACGVGADVLPMSDEPVRTFVRADGRWRPFQEFMIVDRAAPAIEAFELRGIDQARPTVDVLDALARADAVVIGPSNPVISIGPIVALEGVREALRETAAPVVAVSPFVGGAVVKGPTEPFMAHAGLAHGVTGILQAYDGLIDAIVCDEELPGAPLPVLTMDTMMDTVDGRRGVAAQSLAFARTLAEAPSGKQER
jgi:LPPG:FO 2-phospho-L-lactate transferase